jgi:ribosomal protein S18 acetylase RimI-like enzyme
MGTPPRIAIGPARPDEVGALADLELRCFTGDRLSPRQYRRHLRSRTARVLGARQAGRLLGSAVLFFRAGSTVARLYSIAVDPAARGLGIGRRLLRAAERTARSLGARELRLEVRQDNTSAVGLYEAAGYQRFGIHADYYEDGAPAWRYRRALGR